MILHSIRVRNWRCILGELSLDIHDKSARPAAVRAQIKNALAEGLDASGGLDLLEGRGALQLDDHAGFGRFGCLGRHGVQSGEGEEGCAQGERGFHRESFIRSGSR